MTRSSRFFLITCLFLALGTLALYWSATSYPFINFDDDDYITDNPMVKAGLTWQGIAWAFSGAHAANWHPLTWISLMMDSQLFGLNAGGYHLVNILFHIANTLLLFALLRYSTGAEWRSAVVAALFAWHPMHVESVAWISERKDVLSAFFWLLTMLAYARFSRTVVDGPYVTPKPATRHASLYYGLALVFCACAMLAKPMAVTLPFVLLLLDLWPLQRIPGSGFRLPVVARLVIEKIPFFLLSGAACVLTYFAQRGGGAVSPVEWSSRLGNVPVAYARYLSKTFWPADLAIVYPYVYHWPLAAIVGSGLLLVLISVVALMLWRGKPWIAVGWFWFLGTLVPVIGLVQVGAQSMADRYSYVPSIGLFLVTVWGLAEFCLAKPNGRRALSLAGAAALTGCLMATAVQIRYWRNDASLFLHALTVTKDNYVACNALGKSYEMAGEIPQALLLYREAVRIEPRYAVSQFNLGVCLISAGKNDEAFEHLVAAAKLAPSNADAQFNLGEFFLQHERWSDAEQCFNATLKLRPSFTPAHLRLGEALVRRGKFPEAEQQFREAIRLQPDLAEAKTALDKLHTSHPELK